MEVRQANGHGMARDVCSFLSPERAQHLLETYCVFLVYQLITKSELSCVFFSLVSHTIYPTLLFLLAVYHKFHIFLY